jgi:hypothetical protein
MTDVSRRAARIGWSALTLYACAGIALEAAHGWKLAAYLDDALARELLRLAHAHGVGLSLVVILFGVSAAPRLSPALGAHALRALTAALASIPVGFALGAVAHPEGDPSIAILLVPLGALSLVYGLARTAVALWR